MIYMHNVLILDTGERDLIVMRHDIGVEWPDRSKEMRHVNFTAYGEPGGYSAMAATVGYTTGIATRMILNGTYLLCLYNYILV